MEGHGKIAASAVQPAQLAGSTKTFRPGKRSLLDFPPESQTPMAERSFKDEQLKEMLPRYPMGRFGTLDEVAGAVVWLCSGAASFITGHCLQLDGGFAAR